MAKKMTKRAKAQAVRAAKIKAVQKTGYTKHAAAKFVESLKDAEKKMGKQLTPQELTSRASAKREGAIAQSRMRKTARGAQYADRMEETQKVIDRLNKRGIIVRQFEDMAAAAVEGRYKEALLANRKTYENALSELDSAIDEIRQEIPRLRGDEQIQAREDLAYLNRERDSLVENFGMYGTGKPLNIKNTSSAKVLGNLM